jgi:hypothetical protein
MKDLLVIFFGERQKKVTFTLSGPERGQPLGFLIAPRAAFASFL